MKSDSFFRVDTMSSEKNDFKSITSTTCSTKGYIAQVWTSWNTRAAAFAKQVEGTGSSLFQSEFWLSTWYDTFATQSDIEPVIIAVEDRRSNKIVLLLPLSRRRENGLWVISFADSGLADYNASLIDPDHKFETRQIDQLIRNICKSLPNAHLLKLEKMPKLIHNTMNPLYALPDLQKSNLSHYGIEITASWDEYWSGLKRSFRKDQARRWRVLKKKGEVSFILCQDETKIPDLLSTLMRQQRSRLTALGLPYLLDDPQMKQFYEHLITKGCVDGPVLFTALLVDNVPVATLCGFGDGHHYGMTVSGYEMGEWSKCSPGRLLTEQTMQTLHEKGYNYFDFTIGDEPYKKYFAIEQGYLHEICRPLSVKGIPHYVWMKIKAAQRRSPLVNSVRNLFKTK